MKQCVTNFIKNFLKCGLAGWCLEILFTSMDALRRRDMTLKGQTSLWMFPIYGSAAILSPVSRLLRGKSALIRGLTYMSLIFSTEYLTGRFLSRKKICPWDYRRSRWNIGRVIRLDFAPYWFFVGLLYEQLLSSARPEDSTPA